MRKALTLDNFMDGLKRRNPREPEFHQAVYEVAKSLVPFIRKHPEYRHAQILERMTQPDRVISFRVCWHDDKANIRTNQGFRIQFNNAIGPYKGGLRFHRDLNLSVLKFLGFEQTFKNSLTTLPLGAAKGGADFNPKGKSDNEVMRFCQAYMTELARYLGPHVDVPAGDGGVGSREIAYLFGQYKRLTHQFDGALTGKPIPLGGSLVRSEATGYGCAYFMMQVLEHRQQTIEGKTCVLSGAGNVALFCAEKLIESGARVVSLSDTSGFVHAADGLTREQLREIKEHKLQRREPLAKLGKQLKLKFHKGKQPWGLDCELAFPCASQNEIGVEEAKQLVKSGCQALAEGANMPVTPDAYEVFADAGVVFVPGKAANAGGVAVSGLEMSQNRVGMHWTAAEVDQHLRDIMAKIHEQCLEHSPGRSKSVDYVRGANIAGFIKVADAMLAYGVV
ncbi:NADP-specific glutamate dehydrogenase [Pseudomaricurvus alcaniphilus]|uniref:NADP-specific glutamate dehydrogenase n=1 Tax=Pseudomaricurvus alcaniphilus TaxID=1166482 RepID=UPI001409FB47|nr:NADP-specific glutamate dehydrogenase [Pseudomaricurvus alcaniphilus]NHN37491.1 NADP-specific glutamate dehydrogenase [Pseudomaricurvus alcaniphilus]